VTYPEKPRNLVVGRVSDDRRIWIGVENDEKAYDRLEGSLSGNVTHALIIGDDTSAAKLAQLLIDEIKAETEGTP
jgi:hypothetical protein